MQHDDSGQRADNASTEAVDTGKRNLLKRGKLVLPVILTLQASDGLCVSGNFGPGAGLSMHNPAKRERSIS